MAVKGSVPAPGVIVPHLVVRDAASALDFYERAFFSGGTLSKPVSESQWRTHPYQDLVVAGSEPEQRRDRVEGALLASPDTLSGSTCVFQVVVPDVDEAYQRAVDEGTSPTLPPMDMFWGDRYGWVRDPFGRMWALTTVTKTLTPEEVDDRLRSFGEKALRER